MILPEDISWNIKNPSRLNPKRIEGNVCDGYLCVSSHIMLFTEAQQQKQPKDPATNEDSRDCGVLIVSLARARRVILMLAQALDEMNHPNKHDSSWG